MVAVFVAEARREAREASYVLPLGSMYPFLLVEASELLLNCFRSFVKNKLISNQIKKLRKLKLFEMRIKTWNFRTTTYG